MNIGGGRTAGHVSVLWVVSAALALIACGADDAVQIEAAPVQEPTTTTTGPQATRVEDAPAPSSVGSRDTDIGVGAWVLGQLPEGFTPAVVQELEGRRAIVYQHESNSNDLFDGPLRITTSNDGPGPEGIPGADEVALHGQTGYLLPLSDDGVTYGTMVMWPDAQQRWVMLMWGEEVSDDEVLALALGAREVSADEWDELNRTLGAAAVIGGEVTDAIEEIVAEGSSSDGTPYRLVALVPPDYPLTDTDRRLTCFRLDIGDEPGDRRCESHGWWARFGGSTFVYGPVSAEASEVILTEMSIDGSPVDATPVVTDVVRTELPAPIVFYLVEVPGWCWVDVTVTDGTNDLYSMPGGPLPANEHHAECMTGQSSPSTTAGP